MIDNMLARSVTHAAIVIGVCVTTSGCGTSAFVRESTAYMQEVAAGEREALHQCATRPPAEHHTWDHRMPASEVERDCYLAVVNPASSVLVTPPQQPSGEPKPTKADPGAKQVQVLSSAELSHVTDAPTLVGQVAWPALLSRLVYRDYVSEPARNNEGACLAGREWNPLERLNRMVGRPGGSDRWESWRPEGIGCFSGDGLFYETFVFREFKVDGPVGGVITQAFIVFRGTENLKGAWWDDWVANMSMAFGITPRQFELVSKRLPLLLDELKPKGAEGTTVYTAGHSLGGGLAQTAAYIDRRRAAYAFDTSPVNAWTWMRRQKNLIKVPDPQIIRVINDYEALSAVRKVTNAANSTVLRTGRVDVTFTFPLSEHLVERTNAGFLKRAASMHSMALLACNLSARVAQGAPTAFSYPREMAAQAIAEQRHDTRREPDGINVAGLCEIPAVSEQEGCVADWIKGDINCSNTTSR